MKGRGFLSSMVLFQKHNNDLKKKRCRRFPSIRRNHTLLGAVEVTLGWLLNWRRESKAKIEVTLGSPSSAAWRVKTEATKCLFLSSLELKPQFPLPPFLKIEIFKSGHKQKYFFGGVGEVISVVLARVSPLCTPGQMPYTGHWEQGLVSQATSSSGPDSATSLLMDWEAPERELGSFMGTASCECEHTQQKVISAGVKLPHSGSACADNGWRPGGPCIILLPAPSEVTLEWRDTLGGCQFPRQSLQTSPQSLCLVTSPPLRAEGSQPHSSPSKQTTCPESCGMPLSHCLHRVLAVPQDHGLRRDTCQVSCQLPHPGSINGV